MARPIAEAPSLTQLELINKIAERIFDEVQEKTMPGFPCSVEIPINVENRESSDSLVIDEDGKCSLRLENIGTVGLGSTWDDLSIASIATALEDIDARED